MSYSQTKEYRREYMREYWKNNKDKAKAANKRFLEKHPDYAKNYYQNHKERMYETQREWQHRNREKFARLCHESRKRRVEKLRENGCSNAWGVVVHGAEPKYKNVYGMAAE